MNITLNERKIKTWGNQTEWTKRKLFFYFYQFHFRTNCGQTDTMCEQIMDDGRKKERSKIDLWRWKRDRKRVKNGMKWVNRTLVSMFLCLAHLSCDRFGIDQRPSLLQTGQNDKRIFHFKPHSFVMCLDVNYEHNIRSTVGFILKPFWSSSFFFLFKWI